MAMSYNMRDKDYGDYFDALERRINKNQDNVPTGTQRPSVSRTSRYKSHRFRVIRIRFGFLAVVTVLIVGIIAGIIGISTHFRAEKKTDRAVDKTASDVKKDVKSPTFAKYNSNTVTLGSEVDAANVIIIDVEDNTVVAAKKAEDKAYPASTTKIMTLLVAVENISDLNDTFTMTLDITDPLFVAEASVAGFLNGETITMQDMLYGTILPSGADAAMGLAIKIAGSEEGFVKLMNDKAKALGLKNTHFTNVSGLYDENHYTTAHDMAVILRTAMENDVCRKVLSTYQYTTSVTPQHSEGILLSSTLFNYMYGTEPETATILGGKTGFVNESGYCIASFGKNNNSLREYIVVTFGSSSRKPAFFGQIDLYKNYAKK